MDDLTLNGSWQLFQAGEKDPIPATVPGTVHTDLLAAGRIPDPYYRANESRVQWIGETDWTYTRHFQVDEAFVRHERILLRCLGLDTLARLTLNGQPVGQADNMFRTWEFDAKPALRPGENILTVHFAAPLPYGRRRLAERHLPNWGVDQYKLAGGNWLRKEQCNFGWDWGPSLVTCGIWRDIGLVAFDTARLADVHLRQDHTVAGQVTLRCAVALDRLADEPLTVEIAVSLNGTEVARAQAVTTTDSAAAALMIADPQLWWPNGLGAQPLYHVRAALRRADGTELDAVTKRIGLRTLRLERAPDEWGESFYFSANGVPFFAKGANWIPADCFAPRVSADDYRRLLNDAAAVHMNMLRVWGGGIYEPDLFYDLCDELGICIWQDFMFACAAYPTFDAAFMATVEREIEDNVRRLRHHPAMALWCGNNELEQGLVGAEWTERTMSWEDYARLFDQLIPNVVARLDPDTAYWPSSAHSPLGNRLDFNSPKWGDAHIWEVWHGGQPFEYYRTCFHRFNSEFGFQSFPEPRTVAAYTEPDERNITSYVMEFHQRSPAGNRIIMQYLMDWFRLPADFEMTLWLTQILQGMAMRYAVEHWRRTMPRGMGTLYWQLNDCWPVASWSSIDYFGRWKALHYMARRFYAPALVSGVEDRETGAVEIHVTSDAGTDQRGVIAWFLTSVTGEVLESGTLAADIPARRSQCVTTLDFGAALREHGAFHLLLWLELRLNDQVVSRNLVLWARPKHLALTEPGITAQVETLGDREFRVMLAAEKPALWAWLTLDGLAGEVRFSDNFVHLRPGDPQTVRLTLSEPVPPEEVRAALRVHSLRDTYR